MNPPIDIREEAGVRYLHFGSEWVQGAMRIARPWHLELAYTQEMMAGLLFHEAPWPRRVLLIGLGAASLTRFLHKYYPSSHLDIVEISPAVVAAAKQFFKLPPPNPNVSIHIADGAQFVLETNQKYDLILVDGFDEHARAGALDTAPFYLACRARLSEQGLMSVNLFGRSRGFANSIERILKVFDDRAIAFPSSDSGNVIAHANAGELIEISMPLLRKRALTLKTNTGLDLNPCLSRLEAAGSLPGQILRL